MISSSKRLCEIIRNRTKENRQVIQVISCIYPSKVPISPAVSILRQELDSMVKVIYLLSVSNITERETLIRSLLDGGKWKKNGKDRNLTDRDMVERANKLQGWTLSVYKFGCAFIHLSYYHDYYQIDPFGRLSEEEQNNILSHMRHYHGGPENDHPTLAELATYIPNIFEKIASNLESYLKELEKEPTQPS